MMDMNRVKNIMKALGCTEEEALQIIADDDAIDHGAKLFELTDLQKKVAKEARSVDRKPKAPTAGKQKSTRKEDADKLALMSLLQNALGAEAANLTVLNAEREMTFTYNDRKFKVVLSAPRS